MSTKEMLKRVFEGEALNQYESGDLFKAIFSGELDERELAALLAAMKVRGETPEEIAGAALSMREFALEPKITDTALFDTCGTGGDGKHSFNVSSAVALILCSMGYKIVKHGNRSVSSLSGSADFYEELGVPIALNHEEAGPYFDKTGFVFLFAPNFHPAMKYAMPVRKTLATRTIFNFLGPLTNPMKLKRQMIGVYAMDFLPVYAEAAKIIGYDSLVLYSSEDGMDEVSPYAPTHVVKVSGQSETKLVIDPSPFITHAEADQIPTNYNAKQNAALFVETMSKGELSPLVKMLAINCALALYTLEAGDDMAENVAVVTEHIRSGKVADTLAELKAAAQG